jgi:hypothetical protein
LFQGQKSKSPRRLIARRAVPCAEFQARGRASAAPAIADVGAGNYRLELAEKASGLRTERGLVWQISCAESRSVLAETNL